jgi:hypothetical protein
MGHHEGDTLNTLPKYNYSNGAGWKTSGKCKLDFTIKSKRRLSRDKGYY